MSLRPLYFLAEQEADQSEVLASLQTRLSNVISPQQEDYAAVDNRLGDNA